MSDHPKTQTVSSQPLIYQIRIEGHLSEQWVDWFDGLSIMLEEDGNTLLTGPVIDQAALHGLLKKVRDLGLPLVSVSSLKHGHQLRSGQVRRIGQTSNSDEDKLLGKYKEMNISATPTEKIDTKILLSTLWIVVMINMLKADILSLYIPGAAEELAKTAGEAAIPQLMLGGAIMMELAIAMIILSRVLKYGVNRWLNIIVGVITMAFVVAGGAPYPHYIFIAAVEVICLLLIIWNAWKWRNVEA